MSDVNSQNSCKSSGRSGGKSNADRRSDTCYDRTMAEPHDKELINFIATTVETMRDQMATKDDLVKMATKIDVAAIRGDLEQVQVRLDSIDRALGARLGLVETDISRLRSVLYLLVKDKPDMLRLLGQPTPGENRP